MSAFTYKLSGATHIVTGASGVQMVMLVRKGREYFTDFIAREAKAQKLKVVVNGSFIDLTFAGRVAAVARSAPLDATDSTPTGEVIQQGKLLQGPSSNGKFNFAQNTCGVDKFSAGLGNPSGAACAAIGGIAPIIIDDVPYGATNSYKAGVPAGAPLTGDVDAKYLPFLVQKSNAMFAAILARGTDVGKTAIGFSNSTQTLLVLSQKHGTTGMDANDIRTVFAGLAMSNAVFLDCSDSATLYYDGKFLVSPGAMKNEYLTVAVGFK
jgi:hypothetical protein